MARLSAMKEAFALFDRDLDGLMPARDMPTVLRSLGVNPTEDEINKLLAGREDKLLTFDEFVDLAGARVNSCDPLKELVDAFKNFDRDNNGTVNANELKHVLINLGEKLTGEDVERLLNLAQPDERGNIKYEAFAKQLVGRTR